MNVFDLRDRLVSDYGKYVQSFINIRDPRIRQHVEGELEEGLLWPESLIQLNPSFEPGATIDELVTEGILHEECRRAFRKDKDKGEGKPLRLHRHQTDAINIAHTGANYVLTTGTGSGKSLAYIIPIVDHILRNGSRKGIQAIVVYPMNALANSQEGELRKFLCQGYPDGRGPVTFARYTGQEKDEEKQKIIQNPPDILLTNYVMLELLLTRPHERGLIEAGRNLRFLVLDELHTYRGRQGADVALLARRAKEAFSSSRLQYVGTSATLAGPGTLEEQKRDVARVASQLFGSAIVPESVIGETLCRATPERDFKDPEFVGALRKRIEKLEQPPPSAFRSFIEDPLSIWIESTFGIHAEPGSKRLIRKTPQSISGPKGAAHDLSRLTGIAESKCAEAIRKHLLASYACEKNPETGFPAFAFRLHQFISRGDTVYATSENENTRHVTVHGQQFVPGSREKILLPLVFCRECGQEYYCVRMARDEQGERRFGNRELSDRIDDDGGDAGFLYISTKTPWPSDAQQVITRLPEEWLEVQNGTPRIRKDRQKDLPIAVRVAANGIEEETGTECHYLAAPFRFCLACGVSYGYRQTSDFAKLASLGTEGRSTATTILSLAAIRYLRGNPELARQAKKLLSFTDNRQDASLQAGHFNDFIEIGLLRSALLRATQSAGPQGIAHETLVQKVFESINLPLEYFAADPAVRFQALEETNRALRSVLGYRLYRDLERGWRITSPNLEQCGLLEIRYLSLEEACRAEDIWQNLHPALATAKPETRAQIAKTLLDYMRREITIKVDYLDPSYQERMQQQSSQRLVSPWALDENEKLERAKVLFPRSQTHGDFGSQVYLSGRGGFGQYLRRANTFPNFEHSLKVTDTETLIRQLLEALRQAGLVEIAIPPRDKNDVPGYQLPASAILWVAGDGSKPYYDPIRVPSPPESGGRTNPFFIDFYKTIAAEGVGLEAREHTAQVQYQDRLDREQRFREGRLPILYCSPTMELGVDIAELNVVSLRNVPPTPANYAQRSGRAGRSGQPALVFSYCSTYSSHDQYFFNRPELMVAGAVSPPRLDLTNEDLIRSHIQAIWLAETRQPLGSSLKELLDLSGENPPLVLLPSVRDSLENTTAKERARARARRVLDTISDELKKADWYSEGWLDEVLSQVVRQFDVACDRWRSLYRAASQQRILQHKIAGEHSRSEDEKKKAKRLRAEAEAQLEILTEAQNAIESDFYSYRYFASEGFLPGYNFPRLPLSAFIPGRKEKKGRNEFLSRPRFLAISEFGPRAIVYHEGSRYRINKVILPLQGESEEVVTYSVKQCATCGYLHPSQGGAGADTCERCQTALGAPLTPLFRVQNVSTKRADKINSDEEERLRLGYEIRTGVRFGEKGGQLLYRTASVLSDGKEIAKLTYGHAATLWRVNLGWKRRKNQNQYGFVLDTERGYWAADKQSDPNDEDDPQSPKTQRVIPFVEDRRNCLLVEPTEELGPREMASLQAALKNAIQVEFQLEEMEIAAEPLPSYDSRRILLFYEAAEGGAGVLRRLLDDATALGRVAARALEICHFDRETGADRKRGPRSKEDCEAACYDCLMSYSNQIDHEILDRQTIKDLLLLFGKATVEASPVALPRAEHLAGLLRQCESKLEKDWLNFVEAEGLRLPSKAQCFVDVCKTRPDFLYEASQTAVYIDGPPHDYPERQERDDKQQEFMEDQGFTVLRFHHQNDWQKIVSKHPNVFGKPS